MKKGVGDKMVNKKTLLSFVFFFVILSVGFVLATHTALNAVDSTQIVTVVDDTDTFVNVSIRNNDTTWENITSVKIILPEGTVNFTIDTNQTDAGTHSFINSANSTLIWNNSNSLILNQTLNYFSFNATAISPGKGLNITVETLNTTGFNATTNITFNVNDTVTLSLTSPSNVDYANVTESGITNITYSGNETLVSVNVTLWNSTGAVLSNVSVNTGSFTINYTAEVGSNLVDGLYSVNASWNNSVGDGGTLERYMRIDSAVPTITLTKNEASTDKNNVVIDISIGDTSGIPGTCTANTGGTSITGTGATQTLTHSGLSCNQQNNYVVTCTDYAGLSGTSASLTVSSDSCGGGSFASGGSGSSSSSSSDDDDSGTGSSGSGSSGSGASGDDDLDEGTSLSGEEGSGGGVGSQSLSSLSTTSWVWIVIILVVVVVLVWYFMKKRK